MADPVLVRISLNIVEPRLRVDSTAPRMDLRWLVRGAMANPQIFISYSGHDSFEASLLQYAIESTLSSESVSVWTYQRDQARSESDVASALKETIRKSVATVFLVSPATIDGGAAQWMELAYSDAFGIPTFVLLHHLDFKELKARERGVPPLLLASQCNAAHQWKAIVDDLRTLVLTGKAT